MPAAGVAQLGTIVAVKRAGDSRNCARNSCPMKVDQLTGQGWAPRVICALARKFSIVLSKR